MKSSYSLIALAGTLTLGVVCFNGSANAQASAKALPTRTQPHAIRCPDNRLTAAKLLERIRVRPDC